MSLPLFSNLQKMYFDYIFLVVGGEVSWTSKRQKTTSLSTTEVEYMAATQVAKEAIGLEC